MKKVWGHDDLAHDLAMHLRAGGKRLVWCNLPLGEHGSPRPDVFSLIPFRWAHPEITAFEVKVSQTDLRADLTAGKWQGYLPSAECVVFAVPQGLATKADIPPTCGLMVRSERGWRTARKGIRGVAEMSRVLSLKLIAQSPAWRDEDKYFRYDLDSLAGQKALKRAGESLAKDIAELLRIKVKDRARVLDEAKNITRDAVRLRDQVRAEVDELCRVLGLDTGAAEWRIAKEIKDRASLLSGGPDALGVLTRACERAGRALDEGRLLCDLANGGKA
jgi:hypothetical protein